MSKTDFIPPPAPVSPGPPRDFASLYAACHLDLLRYVLSLLPNREQAGDVVQETARVLWLKFDQFDPSRPFWPWARAFAHLEVLKFRKRLALEDRYFSNELIEALAVERVAFEDHLAGRRQALEECLQKLDPASRELLARRYDREISLQDLAREQGKSANSLYLSLHRLRQKLWECVNRRLSATEAS